MADGATPGRGAQAQWPWLVATALVPVFALGIRYLTVPYGQLEESGIIFGPGLLALVVAAMVACALGGIRVLPAAATAGLVGLVVSRVVIDVAADPTSHNLWPFEVAIACVIGGLAALLGAFLGGLLRSAARR